ncbi:fumarylacetoacetate hydrolase family protein [Paenalkalicoccus suaedae]|uniref:Fumarylacetoacetate hydrolase family protein n=1 Tax=Paenalkalicoccus suaedae TaxID=2592382 RepID=A0A859FHM4_9BACI|nr:fumarylacetoacetate hydrolase family protein [Paenalkalicoccus suaedae]QKS72152.1 fumarylacetoacetate hydrolase family protein [Paenalkalicoccus suaedae]
MNIICVGLNYALHAKEMKSAAPSKPVLFSKPSHALVEQPEEIVLPKGRGRVDYEAELVLKLKDTYETGADLADCVEAFTLGLDLTLRDEQAWAKENGKPWLVAKGFKGSAIIGEWQPFISEEDFLEQAFRLTINGETRQQGSPRDMTFSVRELLEYGVDVVGLGKGDLLFTGTPDGIGPLHEGDKLQLSLVSSGKVLHKSVVVGKS